MKYPPSILSRREFLLRTLASGAALGAGSLLSPAALAAFPRPSGNILVNVSLLGGPDFRHLLPPAYNSNRSSYGYNFWKARHRSYDIGGNATSWRNHWNNKFWHRSHGNTGFGIHKSSPWLRDMWDNGNVAIINNVFGSTSRDHEHSIMVMDQGDRDIRPSDINRAGWGGRLAQYVDANVVSVSRTPRPFCWGSHESGDISRINTANLVGVTDSREMSMYEAETSGQQARWDQRGMLARSVKTYYKSLRRDLDEESIYREFMLAQRQTRKFGQQIDDRLRSVREPARLKTLYHWDSSPLKFSDFGLQTRNLYDCLACSDILNMRVASMEMGDWDTHEGQASTIQANFRDMFGANMTFDTLWANLPASVRKRVVFCFQGEFGRQLVANGENGTDHGKANSVILVGGSVRGGVYGDMFPSAELGRINDVSADIRAGTAIDHVYGAVCDWVAPGSGDTVFPGRQTSRIESGIRLGQVLV